MKFTAVLTRPATTSTPGLTGNVIHYYNEEDAKALARENQAHDEEWIYEARPSGCRDLWVVEITEGENFVACL